MIMLDSLGKYRMGRLWIDEIPNICYDNTHQLQFAAKTEFINTVQSVKIALELSLPQNSSNYALLGISYTPSDNNIIEVKINASSNTEEKVKETIVSAIDEIYVGIPLEYANAVKSATQSVIEEINDFPNGILEFNLGAHGLIGSSNVIFSRVTYIILKLLCKNPKNMTIEEIKDEINRLIEQEK